MTAAEKFGQRYDNETRRKLGMRIKEEWNKMSGSIDSADEFVLHMRRVLHKEGFRSAAGGELSDRGVRYQIFRQGIRFRKRTVYGRKPEPSRVALVQAPKPVPAAKKEPLMPKVLEVILTDDSLNSNQRLSLVKAYFGV